MGAGVAGNMDTAGIVDTMIEEKEEPEDENEDGKKKKKGAASEGGAKTRDLRMPAMPGRVQTPTRSLKSITVNVSGRDNLVVMLSTVWEPDTVWFGRGGDYRGSWGARFHPSERRPGEGP